MRALISGAFQICLHLCIGKQFRFATRREEGEQRSWHQANEQRSRPINAVRKPELFAFTAMLLLACQSSKPVSLETDEVLEIEEPAAQQIPMELWTPARRQVNASYFFMIAEYEALSNNRGRALRFYEDAYNLDPNAYIGVKWLALKGMEDPEGALLQARRMVLLYPRDSDIQSLYGQLLSGVGYLDEAYEAFNRAKSLDPSRIEPYWGLIGIHRSRGQYHSAIKLVQEMLENEPGFADGWALLAKLYLTIDRAEDALAPAKRAYVLQGNDPEKIHLYALALEMNGDSKQAISLYEMIFRMNPANDELIMRMIDLYKQIGSLEDALQTLKEADRSAGRILPGIRLQIVFISWELERYEEATEILDSLLEHQPDSHRIRYMAGLGREKLGHDLDAIKLYESIPEDSEFFIHAIYRSIHLHRRFARHQAAIRLAKKVIHAGHERVGDFYGILAGIYADKGNYKEATLTLREATKNFPERIDLLFLLGVNLERAGNLNECFKVMRQVIDKDPEHSAAYNYLGYLYAERGENLDEAEELILKALELKPNDGYYLDSLGWVYYQRGEYEKALEILKRANELAPNEGVILEHIGDCYLALGYDDRAYEYYKLATKGRLEDRDHDRVMSKYRKMKADVDT